jgi:vacuolar-type H+-ATPase subunit B/Vma2
MSLANFNRLRVASLYRLFGQEAVIDGVTCTVVASAHRGQSALEEGALGVQFSRTVRCRITDFVTTPREGRPAVIAGKTYRIDAVSTDTQAGEHVLGLQQRR